MCSCSSAFTLPCHCQNQRLSNCTALNSVHLSCLPCNSTMMIQLQLCLYSARPLIPSAPAMLYYTSCCATVLMYMPSTSLRRFAQRGCYSICWGLTCISQELFLLVIKHYTWPKLWYRLADNEYNESLKTATWRHIMPEKLLACITVKDSLLLAKQCIWLKPLHLTQAVAQVCWQFIQGVERVGGFYTRCSVHAGCASTRPWHRSVLN